jgi:hypothetical protein
MAGKLTPSFLPSSVITAFHFFWILFNLHYLSQTSVSIQSPPLVTEVALLIQNLQFEAQSLDHELAKHNSLATCREVNTAFHLHHLLLALLRRINLRNSSSTLNTDMRNLPNTSNRSAAVVNFVVDEVGFRGLTTRQDHTGNRRMFTMVSIKDKVHLLGTMGSLINNRI